MLWSLGPAGTRSASYPSSCDWGEDDINNLITLCHSCHKQAPDDPEEFLTFQKYGGSEKLTTQILYHMADRFPDMTLKEMYESQVSNRLRMFERGWVIHQQNVAHKNKSAVKKKRKRIYE